MLDVILSDSEESLLSDKRPFAVAQGDNLKSINPLRFAKWQVLYPSSLSYLW